MTKKLNLVAAGFTRRKDWDFSDDGTYFRCYEYKGLRISVTKYQDEYYVAIAHDEYRSDMKPLFTWEDWHKTEAYKLEDEFNGCYDVDVEKLKENCEIVIRTINELNEKVANEMIDVYPVAIQLEKEIEMAKKVVEDFKQNFKWWAVDSKYELPHLVDYMNSMIGHICEYSVLVNDMYAGKVDQLRMRELSQRFEKYGYVEIKEDNFYLETMRKALNKQGE